MATESDEIALQRNYYAASAKSYEAMHLAGDEHQFALHILAGLLEHLGVESVLDIGSGTGRAISFLRRSAPSIRVVGIEPVGALREVGHRNGLAVTQLIDGDATALHFADGEFDLVCEFGVLHHIRASDKAVAEMLRVARKAVFISDSNNFGQGSIALRAVKQALNAFGLWKLADFLKTRGKGYSVSPGDGVSYSYSVFDSYRAIAGECRAVHVINTVPGGINPYRSASHVALLGVK